MKKSETITKLALALVKFNGEVGKIAKNAKNPHFKNNYATLDQLIDETRPVLAENGLTVMQFPAGDENGNVVVTTILLHESGEFIESDPLVMKPVKNDPQGMGSAITYAKRYQYGAILSLSTGEDDDGHAASYAGNQNRTTPPANKQQTNNLSAKVNDAAAQTIPETIRDLWRGLFVGTPDENGVTTWYAQQKAAGKDDAWMEDFLSKQMEKKIATANA